MHTKNQSDVKNKILAAKWGLSLAWKIDKKMFLLWTALSVLLATLPAIALFYNRNIIGNLSSYISSGSGTFTSIVSDIVILGLILMISGLSVRLNDDLLYMVMYDSYYLGLEEVMMDSAQQIELTELVKKEVSDEYYAAISRCGSLTDLASSGCSLLGRLTSIISLLVVAFGISKFIFFVTCGFIVMIFYLNSRFSSKVRVVWKEQREKLRRADYFEKLSQVGDTAKETRIFNSLERIKKGWESAYHEIEKSEVDRASGIAQLTFFSKVGFYLFMTLMILYSILQVANNRIGPEILLMIYILCLNISDAISSVPKSFQQLDYGLYGLDIQRRFFESATKIDGNNNNSKADSPMDHEYCFELKNVTFGYPSKEPILKNIDLKIRNGETVALVGSNGSGKTTLTKILLGLYIPNSGEVRFMGRIHSDYREGFITENIGVFFQDYYLFHLTLGENVGLGNIKEIHNEQMINNATKKGGAASIVHKFKKGMNQLIGKQVYKEGALLSGGEGQRLAVSRTHMSDKKIMIFDEPASMLDPIAEMEQFFQIKQKVKEGMTSILVSHRIGFARLADRILVLDNGRIVEDGTHEELMNLKGSYEKLFRAQAEWYETDSKAN